MIVRLLDPVDTGKDQSFMAIIIKGRALYLSPENRLAQRIEGLGTEGWVIELKTACVCWLEKIKKTERGK